MITINQLKTREGKYAFRDCTWALHQARAKKQGKRIPRTVAWWVRRARDCWRLARQAEARGATSIRRVG